MSEYQVNKHFVVFYSPGTFVAETTMKPVDEWDVDRAVEMAGDIKERYGARPYGFKFITKGRKEDDLDSKEIDESGMYYLGGTVKTREDIEAENNSENSILLSNMRINDWEKIITNNNSYEWTQPLRKGDVVLDVELNESQ